MMPFLQSHCSKFRDMHYALNKYTQGCGNIEPTAGHFDLFSSLLSCSPYTARFQFTRHSPDNVLHDWLSPHHWCTYIHNSFLASNHSIREDQLCFHVLMYYVLLHRLLDYQKENQWKMKEDVMKQGGMEFTHETDIY